MILQTGYNNLSPQILAAISRGEIYYLGVELYLPSQDEIYTNPEKAVFRYATSRFKWRGLNYLDNIRSIVDLNKFIGKTFNNFTFELANVERNSRSGSAVVFNTIIRGFRVAVRIIFPNLQGIEHTRLVWWGRVSHVEDVTENSVRVVCSQEIGNFSYEVATNKFGQACPLWFGKGECLGNETFEQKSPLYRAAFNQFGQGGCNRTFERCKQLQNDRFYQGQNAVTVTGQFFREEIVKKKILWIFTIKKKNRIPVQWSSKNQSDNDDVTIPWIIGRAKVNLHAFTWADIGTQIIALMGGCRGQIEGFYQITSHNPELTIGSITQHLGEYGGVGTQQPDPRFPQSGFNSKLAYLGVTFNGSPPEDEPEEIPDTSAIIKGLLMPIPSQAGLVPPSTSPLPPPTIPTPPVPTPPGPTEPVPGPQPPEPGPGPFPLPEFGDDIMESEEILIPINSGITFVEQWTNNPVWAVRNLLLNFPYTVVKAEWFDDIKNLDTSNYCFTVIEDDTDAEIPVISASSFGQFSQGQFTRVRSSGRFTGLPFIVEQTNSLVAQNELLNSPLEELPDIWWQAPIESPVVGQSRTYLVHRYSVNGVINDKAKLSDILFSLLLPTFRGFIRFNHFGKIEIDCRKPAKHSYVRFGSVKDNTRIDVINVSNFFEQGSGSGFTGATLTSVAQNELLSKGYVLIGVGTKTAEIAKITGVSYVNGNALTEVTATSSGTLNVQASESFIERTSAPSEIYIDFSGVPTGGEKIELKFEEPDGTILKWDYFVSFGDSLDLITQMFKTRLMASPSFRETWTAEIFSGFSHRIVVRCQTGYLHLDRQLLQEHHSGEEIIRVVEVYEDGRDGVHAKGIKDNMRNFVLNARKQETYHGVKSVYISAVQDFRETEIQPRIAWDAAEEERNLNLLELDLRFVDNYRQAAFLTKSAAIEFVDGNLWATWGTGIRGMFHEEGDIVAVRHQTMQGISYTPFTIEDIDFNESNQETKLGGKIYFSAAFDERVAKEEKFLETALTPNPDIQTTPPPILTQGGYSSTRTGDGQEAAQNITFESQTYETFPGLQRYSPEGRDKL